MKRVNKQRARFEEELGENNQESESEREKRAERTYAKKKRLRVDAKVGYGCRQNVFSLVTEHAAAKTHQL